MTQGMNIQITVPRPLGKRVANNRVRRRVMMLLIESMVAYYESVTQEAPDGIPVVTGMARGAFFKLTYRLQQLARTYNVKGLHFDRLGDGPLAKPGQNSQMGEDMTTWDIWDVSNRPKVHVTFTTDIPYFAGRESTDEYQFKGNKRPVPWNLIGQGSLAFQATWQASESEISRELIAQWPLTTFAVHGNKVTKTNLRRGIAPTEDDEEEVPF